MTLYLYLAHPIDQALIDPNQALNHAITHIHEGARQQGHALFRPGGAHRLPTPPWSPSDTIRVDNINRNAIWESDGLIAILPQGLPTLGTSAEIEHALMLNRPVLLITTRGFYDQSVQIMSWENRGATCRFMNDSGHIDSFSIADALSSLPDPTMLVSDSEQFGGVHPDLLITGAAANAKKGVHQGDAGIDLAINSDLKLAPGAYVLAPTGVHAAIPPGWFGWITGRSSTWNKHRCQVLPAIIDCGYRGMLMIGIQNLGDTAVHFGHGTRLAQMMLLPTWQGNIEIVDDLPEHERGMSGYGSSGA